jgi:putative spermidine/putrescine transport system permease protein
MGLLGALFGLLMGMSMGNAGLGILIGAVASVGFSYVAILGAAKEKMVRWVLFLFALVLGNYAFGLAGIIAGGFLGWFFGWFVFWLFEGRYRSRLHSYLTSGQVLWHFTFRVICGAVFTYLIAPIIVVMPLSFNAQDFFTFTPEMLQFDPAGYSLKHYNDFFYNNEWQRSFKNSLIIAPIATIISVTLGTLAAIGLSQSHVPFKRLITALLISPMIVPLIISATGMFFFYATVGNFLKVVLELIKI